MRGIGLIINASKKGARELARELVGLARDQGVAVYVPEGNALEAGLLELAVPDGKLPEVVDFLLALGGDGTLLAAARLVGERGVPVLGVNFGQLGFLSELEPHEVPAILARLLAGCYQVEERPLLQAVVHREGRAVASFFGLNDAVVTNGAFSRVIKLDAFVNGVYLDSYTADGLIVATATGSTAYSLSAGGPIVSPDLEVMLVTPICPHTLYSRSVVIPLGCRVEIKLKEEPGEVMLTVDGQQGYKLVAGDTVAVGKAPHSLRLMRVRDRSFFTVLRQKLCEG